MAHLRKRYALSPQSSDNVTATSSANSLEHDEQQASPSRTSTLMKQLSFREGSRVTAAAPTDVTIPSATSTFGPASKSSTIGLDHSMSLVRAAAASAQVTLPRDSSSLPAKTSATTNRDSQVIRQNMLQELYGGDSSDDTEEDDENEAAQPKEQTAGTTQQPHVITFHQGYEELPTLTATSLTQADKFAYGSHDDYDEYSKRDTGITLDDAMKLGMMASAV